MRLHHATTGSTTTISNHFIDDYMPSANGNYVNNGDFAKTEDLTDDIDWKFLTTLEGEGNAVIKNKAIEIHTDKAGTVDYSIQLVQPSIPAEKGGEYTVTFDAWADEARTMKVDVSAPDRSYKRYLNDTVVDLTTEKQTYTYTYTMTDKPDANARLEFNFGATDSTATVQMYQLKRQHRRKLIIVKNLYQMVTIFTMVVFRKVRIVSVTGL